MNKLMQIGGALLFTVVMYCAQAQTITQSITLQPGWNAVWLEVQPTSNATDAVFTRREGC